MDRDSNPGVSADDSNREDPGLELILQGNCIEPGKKQQAPGSNLTRCDICCCEMSSTAVMNSHMNGSRHKKKMKALEIVANLRALSPKGVDVGSKISNNSYRCDLCNLTVNSPQQLQVHLSGSKHKSKIAREKSLKFSNMTNMKSVTASEAPLTDIPTPPMKKRKKDEQTFICDICNIVLNSESQYEQHIYSKKHLSKSEGGKDVRKPAAVKNDPDLPSFTSKNKSRRRKESDGDNRNGNSTSIIHAHSADDHTNKDSNKSHSECGNSDDCSKRNFFKNRQSGDDCTGVDLYEVEKFYNKLKSSICKSDESVLKASPRS